VFTSESERVARGRAARAEVPRRAQSQLEVAPDRDAIILLEAQAATRVADLVPIRYGRMLRSPFTFFRGAAAVMANDLAATPHTGLQVQLCGDAHLLNFGSFASPERDLVFDVNDFDETLPGPFEWDVKRLAASVEIAGGECDLDEGARSAAVAAAARSYRETMRSLACQRELEAWYARADEASLLAELRAAHEPGAEKAVEHGAEHARENDSAHALAKLTQLVGGQPRIVAKPPLIVPVANLGPERDSAERTIRGLFRSYKHSLPRDRRGLLDRFRYADLAHKVVGIGSVGTRCWLLLLLGRDVNDPLFLQVKEAQASVLEPFVEWSAFASHAQRIVEGQRLAQAAGDIFLGWTRCRIPTAASATTTCASCATGKPPSRSGASGPRGSPPTPAGAGRRSRGRTHAQATGSRSPPTSARATPSTKPSPPSLPRTPPSTSATTHRSAEPSTKAASPPSKGSSASGLAARGACGEAPVAADRGRARRRRSTSRRPTPPAPPG
jgi:uncharacterized protein (DUF2252 family)